MELIIDLNEIPVMLNQEQQKHLQLLINELFFCGAAEEIVDRMQSVMLAAHESIIMDYTDQDKKSDLMFLPSALTDFVKKLWQFNTGIGSNIQPVIPEKEAILDTLLWLQQNPKKNMAVIQVLKERFKLL